MKKMKSHYILNLLLSLMVCAVCSCSLFDTPTEADTVSYTFTVYTSLNARAAFPAVSTDSVKGYYAYFSDTGSNIIASCKSATAPLTFTFTKLADSMTLNIYAYADYTSYSAVVDSSGSVAALSSVASATYTIASSTITGSTHSFTATLSPVKTGSGTGSVLLKVSYPLTPKTGQTMKKLSYSLNTSTPVIGDASSTTDVATVTSTIAIPSVAVGKYLLELTFYDTESDTVFVKQTYVPVNVWQNLATTKWQAADGTMKDTLTFTADDFCTHNAAPAKIQAAYTTDSTAPSSPTYASWYSSLTNQIAQTESDKNTSLTSDTLANNTTYYAETVAAPGNNTALYITLSMNGQSFAVSNTVHRYTATASGTSLTYTAAEHTETGLESSFTQTSGTLTYAGIVTLYSGTNTIAVTCTASDGTTTAMYTLNILNPYCYVSVAPSANEYATPSDTYVPATGASALTQGAGTSTMPLATIQQAVDDFAYENDVRRKENNSESDMNKYTILITGANTVSSARYSSAVAIVAPTYPFTLTIQGKTADNCTANGIINGTQTAGHRVLLAAGKSSDIKVNLTMKDLYLKGGYSPVAVAASSSPVGKLTGDGACILSSYAAAALTNVYVGDNATDTIYANTGDTSIVAIENSTATLTSCNVNHGNCNQGALYISNNATVTLTDSNVKNNNCCGVYLYGSTVTFNTSNVLTTTFTSALTCEGTTEISGNTSGISATNAKVVLKNKSTVASNKLEITGAAVASGCGIIATESLVIMNDSSSVKGNSITYTYSYTNPSLSGAGIYLKLGNYFYLNDTSSVDSNSISIPAPAGLTLTSVLGSGICLRGSGSETTHLIINGGSITKNSGAYYGGGIYSHYGNITFTKGTVSGNTAINSGGGIFSAESSVLNITGDAVFIKDNTLTEGKNGPQLYLNSGTCTFTGKPTIANATGSTLDNAICLGYGKTIGIGAQLSQKQASETAYIIKPLDISNSPYYANISILTVPSAYTSTVSLTDDVVSNFALTPETFTVSETNYTRTWKIVDTTIAAGNKLLTAGYMYYPGVLASVITIDSSQQTSNYTITGQTSNTNLTATKGQTFTFVIKIDSTEITTGATTGTATTCYLESPSYSLTSTADANSGGWNPAANGGTFTAPTSCGTRTYTLVVPITKNSITSKYSLTFTVSVIQ